MNEERVEFEVHQNGEMVASVFGPTAIAQHEVCRYVSQYIQDGPVKLYLVTRTEIPISESLIENIKNYKEKFGFTAR